MTVMMERGGIEKEETMNQVHVARGEMDKVLG
jgi:hypothetical protein